MAVAIVQTANPAGVGSSSDISTYTGVAIGDAAADRIVAVAVGTETTGDSTPLSCTIDYGYGEFAMNTVTPASFGNQYSGMFYLPVPVGTSATIKVTFTGGTPSSTQNHIAVYKVTGASDTLSASGTDTSDDMDATDPISVSVTIPSGGGFLGVVSCQADSVAKEWANATEDVDDDAGAFRFTTAISTTAGSPIITCTGGTNGENGAMTYIIFASGSPAVSSIQLTSNPTSVNAVSNVATYSDMYIGEAAADRIVVVAVGTELADSGPTACTIDYGSGDTAMTAGSLATFGNQNARLFYLAVSTGTTGTIKVTYGSTTPTTIQNHIAVYRVVDMEFSSAGSDTSDDMDATDPLTTGSISIASGGGFLAISSCQNNSNPKTWANATESIDIDAGDYRFTTAKRTDAGSVTITCTGVTDTENGAMSWIIFETGTPPAPSSNIRIGTLVLMGVGN